MRGLSALYVLLGHLAYDLHHSPLPHRVLLLLGPFRYGHFAVDLFIVLSGYSLMLPVVRSASGTLQGGFFGYIKRRATRILPPYYAALFCSLLLLAVTQGLPREAFGVVIGLDLPGLPSLIAHLFLLHNLSPNWIVDIDGPLWSVATEWQIYFLFPLILLPLYRRFGILSAVAGGFALGLAPHWLFHGYEDKACFQFVGLFALGMLAAVLSFSRATALTIKPYQYGIVALLCFAAVKLALIRHGVWLSDYNNWWRIDPAVGLGIAAVLAGFAKVASEQRTNLVMRFLSSRPLALLGSFSYSIYLIHLPILTSLYRLLLGTSLPERTVSAIMLVATVPVCLICAYLFHLAFERPFMPGRPRTERQAEAAAIVSPAP